MSLVVNDSIKLAESYIKQKKWGRAAEQLQKLIKINSSCSDVVYAQASKALRMENKLNEAENVANEGLRKHPKSIKIYCELAEVPTSEKKWDEAVQQWNSVLENYGGKAPARVYKRISFAYRKLGLFDKAENILMQGMKKHSNDINLDMEYAEVAMDQKEWALAIERWQAIISGYGPEAKAEVYKRIGLAYMSLGNANIFESIKKRHSTLSGHCSPDKHVRELHNTCHLTEYYDAINHEQIMNSKYYYSEDKARLFYNKKMYPQLLEYLQVNKKGRQLNYLSNNEIVWPSFSSTVVEEEPPSEVAFACTCDANFLVGLKSLLLSILRVYPNFNSDFYVFHDGSINQKQMDQLKSLYHKIIFKQINHDYSNSFASKSPHLERIGSINYLYIDALKYDSYERVVFIDCDMIVLNDISPIWSEEGINVVLDVGRVPFSYVSNYTKKPVFNGGLISIPKEYLGLNLYNEAINALKEVDDCYCDYLNRFSAQRFWNIFIAKYSANYLPLNYNCNAYALDYYFPERICSISIIHFTGVKPWSVLDSFVDPKLQTRESLCSDKESKKAVFKKNYSFMLWFSIYFSLNNDGENSNCIKEDCFALNAKLDYGIKNDKITGRNDFNNEKRSPDLMEREIALAEEAVNENNWDKAQICWRGIINNYSEKVPIKVYKELSRAYRMQEKYDLAEKTIRQAEDIFGRDAKIIFEHAEISMSKKDWPEAISRWRKLLMEYGEKAPAKAYVMLSQAYRKQNNYEEADRFLESGLANHPNSTRIAVEYAEVAMDRRAWSLVIERCKYILEKFKEKTPANVYILLSRAYRNSSEFTLAEQAVFQGLDYHSNHQKLHLEAAENAFCQDDWYAALNKFDLLYGNDVSILTDNYFLKAMIKSICLDNKNEEIGQLSFLHQNILSYVVRTIEASKEISSISNLDINHSFISKINSIKKSDTLFILGSGESILDIKAENWEHIDVNNSIGFNNWYAHAFVPDIFVFELKNSKEITSRFMNNFQKMYKKYTEATILWKDCWNYHGDTLEKFDFLSSLEIYFPFFIELEGKSILEFEANTKRASALRSNLSKDKSNNLIFQKRASVIALVDMALMLGFKNIVLCGIDLNNSSYFWESSKYKNSNSLILPKSELRDGMHRTNDPSYGELTIGKVLDSYSRVMLKDRDIKLFVASKKSALYPALELYRWPS